MDDETGRETGARSAREYPGTPRWVKLFVIIGIVVALAVVIVLFLGGHTSPVQHGP